MTGSAACGAPAGTPPDSPKRRQVTEAAEKLFFAHGYGAVSMDQVARTAGVSKATLYAYFPSKDALFAQIVATKGQDSPLAGDLFPTVVTDLRATLEDIGMRVLTFMLKERTLAIYRIALSEAGRFPEVGRAFYEGGPQHFTTKFTAWLEHLRELGLVNAADPTLAATQFLALVRCGVFFRRSLALPPEASEEEIVGTVKAAADTFLKAYGTR
jgi:TetR/AcrR family transcriptional regulator, mexJK operon transcriptional repressor